MPLPNMDPKMMVRWRGTILAYGKNITVLIFGFLVKSLFLLYRKEKE